MPSGPGLRAHKLEKTMESPAREMPSYKSHKTVWALKISKVEPLPNPDLTGKTGASHYGATLTPEDTGYAPFTVDADYQRKHGPHAGGYYVVYADGYKSFSPAKAFEEGYVRIGTEPPMQTSENSAIEQEIQAKGKTAPRVTPADIEANISEAVYINPGDYLRPSHPASVLTICILVLRNGFTVTGESACASPENFDAAIGRKIARENAVAKIWPLMGYALKSELARPVLTEADALADLNGTPRPSTQKA